MIKETINKLVNKNDLTENEAADVMAEIMSGQATDAQISAFIVALRMKGETIDEITGCAKIMRRFATHIKVTSRLEVEGQTDNCPEETIIDTCGTGGDGTQSFNVSTAAAIVISACGLRVAKHGNRCVSSSCGSADVLEALGVNINVTPEKVEECIKNAGIGFLFAPSLHGAMKYAIGPRKQIGIRTIFNILGPLTNPANATSQVLGVYSESLIETMAHVLKNLGSRKAWVVHGKDGMDEISITAETRVAELNKGQVRTFSISPEDFGIKRASLADIKGGDFKENARIIKEIFEGRKDPKRDIVLLNAAAGLVAGEKAPNIKKGIAFAAEAIDSGKAKQKLEMLVKITNS